MNSIAVRRSVATSYPMVSGGVPSGNRSSTTSNCSRASSSRILRLPRIGRLGWCWDHPVLASRRWQIRLSLTTRRESLTAISSKELTGRDFPDEWQGGRYAELLHPESDRIFANVLTRAVVGGDNIVLPLVGRNADRIGTLVDDLNSAGYRVHLRLLDLPVEEAARRTLTRYAETGRFLRPSYVWGIGTSAQETYGRIAQQEGIASHEAYSTDVPFGSPPRHLDGPGTEPPEPEPTGPVRPHGGGGGQGGSEGGGNAPPAGGIENSPLDLPHFLAFQHGNGPWPLGPLRSTSSAIASSRLMT